MALWLEEFDAVHQSTRVSVPAANALTNGHVPDAGAPALEPAELERM